MDHIVNRESVAMADFAARTREIAGEMEEVCAHLRRMLWDAGDYMQDASGREAIAIAEELTEDTAAAVDVMRTLAERIGRSAALLEESDRLL